MSDKDQAQGPTERHPQASADEVYVEPKKAAVKEEKVAVKEEKVAVKEEAKPATSAHASTQHSNK